MSFGCLDFSSLYLLFQLAMDDDHLDNKILYELSTLHEWTDRSKVQPKNALQVLKTLSKSAYSWTNNNFYKHFSNTSVKPSISSGGEFLAVPVQNFIEIRDRKHLFEVYTQVDIEKLLQNSSGLHLLQWSSNSPHLLLCNYDGDIIVLDTEGNAIQKFPSMGSVILQLELMVLDSKTFVMFMLSSEGSLLTSISFTNELANKPNIFDFDFAVSQFLLTKKGDEMLTFHKNLKGLI